MNALKEMKERLEKATGGQWEYQHDGHIAFEFGSGETVLGKLFDAPNDENDARFIAHARTDIERLIRIVEIQQAALDLISSLEIGGSEVVARRANVAAQAILEGEK